MIRAAVNQGMNRHASGPDKIEGPLPPAGLGRLWGLGDTGGIVGATAKVDRLRLPGDHFGGCEGCIKNVARGLRRQVVIGEY